MHAIYIAATAGTCGHKPDRSADRHQDHWQANGTAAWYLGPHVETPPVTR
jgi:hypothetical protein